MKQPEALSEHSLGIAESIATSFFPDFATNRNKAIECFGIDASLNFQGNQATGLSEIRLMIDSIPEISLKVVSYEAQTIQAPGSWTMVIVMGNCLFSDGNVYEFHSSVFVEANEIEKKAFIRSMSFRYY